MDNFELINLFGLSIIIVLFFVLSSSAKNTKTKYACNDYLDNFLISNVEWELILKKAKNEGKFIFLLAFSNSSEQFKKLKRDTLSDSVICNYLSDNFINVSISIDEPFGIGLAAIYKINYSPTLNIINEHGILVAQTHGYLIPKEIIEFGQYGLSQLGKPLP